MRLPFDVDDSERVVEIQPRQPAGHHQVTMDGWRGLVDAVPVGPDRWSLIVRDEATGRPVSVDAVVTRRNGDGSVDVHVNGHRMVVGHRSGLGRRARSDGAAHSGGPQRVVAPMPGKIARVLVRPGDEVQPRQGLVVVEAMKMENELRAARAGRVRDISVVQGQSVDAGAVLLVVE